MLVGAMNHPARDPVAEIEWLGENRFDFVDLTLEPPAACLECIDLGAIQDVLQRYRLGVVTHTAYYLPLSSPFASVRRACLAEFTKTLEASRQIGATIMNIHFHKLPRFFSADQTVHWHVEMLRPLCAEAADRGVTIVLEHGPFPGSNQLEMIEKILNDVPLLRFHLDSGHAKVERGYDLWDEYIDRLGSKLAHVHLSDNDGTADQHLPLGAVPGNITDWPEHIRKLKGSGFDGTVTLEVFAPLREYLLLSRDLVRRWWEKT